MIVTTRYAEEKLLALCSRIKEGSSAHFWRALTFTFAGEPPETREEVRLQLVANLVKEQTSTSVHLFFNADNTIVIIASGLKQAEIDGIRSGLHNLFPNGDNGDHKSTLYDLSVHLPDFLTWVEHQCLQAHEQEVKLQQQGKSGPERHIKVDMDYAKDILARRSFRNDIQIQLVEDDMFTLQLVTNVLRDHTVLKTMDGLDALETYFLNAPDIVFLDINLPSLNGQDVLKQILDFDPDAFVVMLSGNSTMAEVSQAIKTGARGFVTKPFPKEKLLNYVKIYKAETQK